MKNKYTKYIISIIAIILLIIATIINFTLPKNTQAQTESFSTIVTEIETTSETSDNFVSIIPIINI